MGRIKKGLEYFPVSTDFMHGCNIRRIMKSEGDNAFAVLMATLSHIYSGEGYYIAVHDDFYDLVADSLYHTGSQEVERILMKAVDCGLFDKRLFNEQGILTSADIQQQYLFCAKRRSCKAIEPAFCLLDEEEMEFVNRPAQEEKKSAKKSTKTGAKTRKNTQKTCKNTPDDVTLPTDDVTSGPDDVTLSPDDATLKPEMYAMDDKRKEKKEKEKKQNTLPNPPQGGDGEEGGNSLKSGRKKEPEQTDIDRMMPPLDGVPRNFSGLVENLRRLRIPPREQYAIILKTNYGMIGHPVWKAFHHIRDSNGKIRLPGHYLLSQIQ